MFVFVSVSDKFKNFKLSGSQFFLTKTVQLRPMEYTSGAWRRRECFSVVHPSRCSSTHRQQLLSKGFLDFKVASRGGKHHMRASENWLLIETRASVPLAPGNLWFLRTTSGPSRRYSCKASSAFVAWATRSMFDWEERSISSHL